MAAKEHCLEIFNEAERQAIRGAKWEEFLFLNRYLYVRETVSMSGIIWNNIGLDLRERVCRKLVIWGFAMALIFVALILMVNFTNYTTELTAAAPKVDCANKTIDAELAWRDYETVPNLRNSDLHCFCKKTLDSDGSIEGSIPIF